MRGETRDDHGSCSEKKLRRCWPREYHGEDLSRTLWKQAYAAITDNARHLDARRYPGAR